MVSKMMPVACWDEERGVIFVHAAANDAWVRIDAPHDVTKTVALVDPTDLEGEIARLREENFCLQRDLTALGRDPYGEVPAFRGAVCGRAECQCAVPGLPCEEFAGIPETGGFCPRCNWNEAAHRRMRADRVENWLASRPVVGTVYKITTGPYRGLWNASCGGAHAVYRDHVSAVRGADAAVRARLDRAEAVAS